MNEFKRGDEAILIRAGRIGPKGSLVRVVQPLTLRYLGEDRLFYEVEASKPPPGPICGWLCFAEDLARPDHPNVTSRWGLCAWKPSGVSA